MPVYKTSAAALGAIIGIAAPLQAKASPITVPWTGPDDFSITTQESITFAPIDDVFSFDGISQGAVAFAEDTWFLLLDLDGVWTQIFAGGPDMDLDTIPTVSFAAGTLDGIRFMAQGTTQFSGLAGAVFTFDQPVPEPGSLPLFMTALGALAIGIRIRGPQRR
jgi:hypothetical protein